jgi:hypothetical protein
VHRTPAEADRSIPELLQRLAAETSTLVRQELRLAQARDAVNQRVDAVKGKISGAVSSAKTAVNYASESLPSTMRSSATRNPLGLAIGSVAVGFLFGLMFPVSDIERDRIGPIGEQMAENAKSAASNAVREAINSTLA